MPPITKCSSQYFDPFRLSPPTYVPRPLSAPGFLQTNEAESSQTSQLCNATDSKICKNEVDHKNGLTHNTTSDSSLHLKIHSRAECHPLTTSVQVQNPYSVTSSSSLSRNSDSNQNYTVPETIITENLS